MEIILCEGFMDWESISVCLQMISAIELPFISTILWM